MIYSECYIDTMFVRYALDLDTIHLNGFGETIKILERNTIPCSAFVDKIKRTPPIYDSYISTLINAAEIELREKGNKKVVYISIGMERYILSLCQRIGIDITVFELPNNFEKLKTITKKRIVDSDDRIIKLFKEISKNNFAQEELNLIKHGLVHI